jgi:hypothetical protein
MNTHFKYFNLEAGTPLPRFKSMAFFAVVYRARKLLRGLCAADVEAVAASIPRIKRLPGYVDPLYDTLTTWDPMPYMDPQGVVSEAVPSTSDVSALVQNIGRVDLSGLVPQLSHHCTWRTVFSIMALLYVEEALRLQHAFDQRSKAKPSTASTAELGYLSEIAESAIAGIEAVTAAELGEPSLVDQTIIEEHLYYEKVTGLLLTEKQALQARVEKDENQRKSNARKGGLAKNARMRELVADLVRFYDTPGRTFKSKSQAVDIFLSEQSAARLKGFSKTNIKRTLLDWLRRAKKGTRAILPSL